MRPTTRPTYEWACVNYPNRFTMEHVPGWAKQQAPGGGYYAPQYVNDREWYHKTKFPGEPGNPLVPGTNDCYSTGQTWPVGQWLGAPFERGKDPVPYVPSVLVSRAFLEQVQAFLEKVQNVQLQDDAIIDMHEDANVLEFKLAALLKVEPRSAIEQTITRETERPR